jgi:hypothetical protein
MVVQMIIHAANPRFAWDCIEDSPSLRTIRELLATLPDGKLLQWFRSSLRSAESRSRRARRGRKGRRQAAETRIGWAGTLKKRADGTEHRWMLWERSTTTQPVPRNGKTLQANRRTFKNDPAWI